jgi:hypothetical protein
LQGWTAAAAVCFSMFVWLIARVAPRMASDEGRPASQARS